MIIILTCTVKPRKNISWLKQRNIEERVNMYENIISLWIENTKIKIIVLENSGYDFIKLKNKYLEDNSKRLEFITFTYDQILERDRKFLESKEAKGHHELYALNYAYRNSKLINDDIIFKLTGRYYIPNFENIVNNLDLNKDIFVQNTLWRGYYRCEILGCKNKKFNELFRYPTENDMIEEEYTKRINKIGSKLLLPMLKLHKKTMQGVGAYLEYL